MGEREIIKGLKETFKKVRKRERKPERQKEKITEEGIKERQILR